MAGRRGQLPENSLTKSRWQLPVLSMATEQRQRTGWGKTQMTVATIERGEQQRGMAEKRCHRPDYGMKEQRKIKKDTSKAGEA